MRTWGFVGALVVALSLGAMLQLVPPRPASPNDVAFAQRLQQHGRVILITLDGPVQEDVLEGPYLPTLRAEVEDEGVLLPALTASVLAGSLVGYQAIYAGALTSCRHNDCPRVSVETVAEALARRLGLAPADLAVFSSWALMSQAASAHDGVVHVDAPLPGPVRDDGPLWRNARMDDETFSRARVYWEQHHPRFMHLAFLDTDEWAHLGRRSDYEKALRDVDRRLAEVLSWVRALPPEEAAVTTVLVTADHGRSKRDWRHHGFWRRGSREIFVAAIGPLVAGGKQRRVDQTDLRPTMERLYGLCPEGNRGEGRPIKPVVGELPCLP